MLPSGKSSVEVVCAVKDVALYVARNGQQSRLMITIIIHDCHQECSSNVQPTPR